MQLSPLPTLPSAAQRTEHSRALARFLTAYRPCLEILSGPARSLRIQLDQAHVTLGRGPGVDIALDDPELSSLHAEFHFTGEAFELYEDLGDPLLGRMPRGRRLQPGDRFRIGKQWFEFVLQER